MQTRETVRFERSRPRTVSDRKVISAKVRRQEGSRGAATKKDNDNDDEINNKADSELISKGNKYILRLANLEGTLRQHFGTVAS